MYIQLIDETGLFSEREIEYDRREYNPKYNTSLRISKVFVFACRTRSPFSPQPEKKKDESDAFGGGGGFFGASQRFPTAHYIDITSLL